MAASNSTTTQLVGNNQLEEAWDMHAAGFGLCLAACFSYFLVPPVIHKTRTNELITKTMNKLPFITIILASLYQGISGTSMTFAFAMLLAIAFAAGLLKEFNASQVTFASDPVSAVHTRQKTTEKEQELLFYSSADYDRFYDDVDCQQAYQDLQWEWKWEKELTSVVKIQSAAHMFYSKHTIQKLKKVKASIKLQSAWHTSLQYDKFIRVVAGIQVIQSSVRVLCARQQLVDVAVFHSSL